MKTVRRILFGVIPSQLGQLLFRIMGLVLSMVLCVAGATAAETPTPEISVSLRGVEGDVVEQGEPFRIIVRLTVSPETGGSIELAPASGAWSDAITVELAAAGGGAKAARADVVGKATTPHATLDATRVAGGLWLMSSVAMQPVVPGDYVVRARLVIRGGTGWNGEITSDETPLKVMAVSDSAERVTQRTINQAHEALLADRIEAAAAIIDAVLQRTPDDRRLLLVRADIADRAGNPMAALLCLNRGRGTSLSGGNGQPPIEQEELQTRVMGSLFADKPRLENPPTWSWPPSVVIAVPDAELPAMALGGAAPKEGIPPVSVSSGAGTSAAPAVSAVSPVPAQTSSAIAGGSGSGAIVSSAELIDAKIIADPAGQWAVSATAGTKYGKTQYSPAQATGAPNISTAGNSPDAWCPENKSVGTDWLEVSFAKPVHATEVRVRQNDAAGAITKLEAIEPNGTAHLWWEGVDPYRKTVEREIVWFGVRVPPTAYLVAKVKITLNLASGPGWKEIDAVQLVGAGK